MAFFNDKRFFYGTEQHYILETHTNILWLASIYSIIQFSFLVREQHRAWLIQEELKVCWELNISVLYTSRVSTRQQSADITHTFHADVREKKKEKKKWNGFRYGQMS